MSKPLLIVLLLLIPALLILSGWYFKMEILKSIGYVFIIFYVLMAVRGSFTSGKK